MSFLSEIFSNKAVILPLIAWGIAQILKVIIVLISEKKLDFTRLVGSGGMPSAHAASVIALAVVAGRMRGWDSFEFAMAAAFAFIVMYDAAGVRRAAGQQAEMLNMLLYSNGHIRLDEKLKELIGHTPFEVIIGAFIGAAIGLIF